MTTSESLGGLLGTMVTFGVGLWALEKIGGALNKKIKSPFDDTEPL